METLGNQTGYGRRIWALAAEEILQSFHFLATATERFEYVEVKQAMERPATDGRSLFYNEEQLIRLFTEEPDRPPHLLMHILLHCLFGHPFRKQIADPDLWDAACDCAVEKVIAELSEDGGMGDAFRPAGAHEMDIFFRIQNRVPHMTAEEIYNSHVNDLSARGELLRWSGRYSLPREEAEILPIRSLPLYAIGVSAGTGQFLDGEDYEMVEVGPEVPEGANFGVRVAGDSMEPRFHNGQTVWVRQQRSLMTGEIGIFLYDGCAYLKQLVARQDHLALHSLNPAYGDIPVSPELPLRVLGKVLEK